MDSDRLKNSEDRLEVYTYQLKKISFDNEKLSDINKILENDVDQLRKELKILSDSQNRIINELNCKDNELKVTKEEAESLKRICEERKERIDRLKIENDIEVNEYKKKLRENKGEMFVSDYLIERKLYWNKLEKEQFDIKKEVMDIIKPHSLYSPKALSFPNNKNSSTKTPEKQPVTIKTQNFLFDNSLSSDEEKH